jgi:CheY-like chemotaxis protein
MLATPLPMLLDWGERHISVVNAAYAELAQSRFVRVPGAKVPTVHPAPISAAAGAFARARAGETLVLERQPVSFLRDEGPFNIDCDLHLLPVCDEHASVCGVLCTLQPSVAVPADASAGGASSAERSLRVLVVEDNLDSQYLVCEMLRAFGHEPDGAGHGEAALDLLAGKRYDVLFSDVSLPGISGVELARRAVAQFPGLQVIFASGYGDTLLRQLDFPYQSLQKPYELDHLQNALASIVRRPQSGV